MDKIFCVKFHSPTSRYQPNPFAHISCIMLNKSPTAPNRSFFTKQRKNLSSAERLYFANQANLHLPKLRPLLPANAKIALYQDSFGELPTFGIVQFCLKHHFVPYLPIVKGDTMIFAPLIIKNNAQFCFANTPQKKHRLGMNEPISRDCLTIDKLHACFCPLVALDKLGVRMGMGGGFYDRTLKNFTGLKIGWCYDFQVIERLNANDWDIKMDLGVTPSGVLRF